MEPREIPAWEVKIGDRVRIAREFVVANTNPSSTQPLHDGEDWRHVPRFYSLTLVDRPIPPIPTEDGTAVRSKSSGAIYVRQAGRWFNAIGVAVVDSLPLAESREHYDVLVPEQVDQ